MADVVQTSANAKMISRSAPIVAAAGEALVPGNFAYQLAQKWYKTDANDGLAKAQCEGMVLTPASTDGTVIIAPNGSSVDVGGTLAVGTTYGISATTGGICPIADITSGQYPTVLGTATTTSLLPLAIIPATVAKA